MENLMLHAKLIAKMHKNKLNLKLIRKFPVKEIEACCNRIEGNKILNNIELSDIIQSELIRDENAIEYIALAYEKQLDIDKLVILIKNIQNHNEKITDYPVEDIINILNNEQLNNEVAYDYLKYFRNSKEISKNTIIANLKHFHEQYSTKLEELNNEEIKLFYLPYLSDSKLIPNDEIKRIYELLSENESLRNFIDFLYSRNLSIPLSTDDYETIKPNAKETKEYIGKIITKIQNDEVTKRLLLRWICNGCSVYDLKIIEQRCEEIKTTQIETIFNNKTSYINFIYGNKLKEFPLDSIYGEKEELIVYAISNNKKRFLKLIEENMNEFLLIPTNSILYLKKFYTKYINLNDLTLKNLIQLQTMLYGGFLRGNNLKQLTEQVYTFEEINTLYDNKIQYINLYNELLDLKVDERLLRIRQFIKKQLLGKEIDEIENKSLALRIKEKPLYTWIEKDFNKINGIKPEDAIKILINYDQIIRFIPDINDKKELSYILRNLNDIQEFENLKDIKENIEKIDRYWNWLKYQMELSHEFIEKYRTNIREFLLDNGAELAYTYYKECNETHKESFKLIVKAELMGEFKKLKYHTNDLTEEIDYQLNEEQIKEWTQNNSKLQDGVYDIGEYDDFYHTMILGEQPLRTCLSYKDGGHNRCLLACFDSNKKILYAKINGKIVARAMVRLTKGAYKKVHYEKTLSFVDLENNIEIKKEECEEYLVIFLERVYIADVSDSEWDKIKKMFIKLLEEKAKKMNALLVLSNVYAKATNKQYINTRYYMYISKSKASSQYLDSLNGSASVTDEGQYKANNFLIWRPIEEKEEIFESIFNE